MAGMTLDQTSEKLREKGNQLYKSVTNELAPVLKQSRLEQALHYYQKAFNTGVNETEKASAAKNIAIASYAIATLSSQRQGAAKIINYYYKEALTHYTLALSFSESKPIAWQDGLFQSVQKCVEDALEYASTKAFDERVLLITMYASCVDISSIKADIFHNLALITYHQGISYLQTDSGRECLYFMKECNFPIEEAWKLGGKNRELLAQIDSLKEDVLIHSCIAEALIAKDTGDSLLESVIKDQETLNMDLIWDIIDWYRQSILLTRENSVEMEAVAYSRLGRVYDQVLKMKTKASENYKQAIHLAMSMTPRVFDSKEWFKESRDVLQRYQNDIVEQESIKWQKERSKILPEISQELALLDSNLNPNEKFLRYIYNTHPPKDESQKLEPIPEPYDSSFLKTMQKILRNAICHYHPDRCDIEKHGKKWKVLSEEIVKRLNAKYSILKVPP